MNNLILGGGYIGSSLFRKLPDWKVATRKTWKDFIGEKFDIIINAACPAARFTAQTNPNWDFNETVVKTHNFLHSLSYNKFIQISSISAETEFNRPYGKHKRIAEMLVENNYNLNIRLTATYDDSLTKGVIYDIIHDNPIYLSNLSYYSFAPLDWVTSQIVKNLDKRGLIEIGGKDNVSLKEICKELNIVREFKGDYVDTQDICYDCWDENAPGKKELIEFIKERL